ncbi:RGS domain-containing protein [Plasmodiophora brassicae]
MSAIRVGMLLSVHCDEPTNIRDPVFGAIWVLTVAFLARSLRSTTDAFHAMTEFKALFVMVGVGFVLVVPDMAIASVGRLVNPYYYFQLVFLVVGMSWNAISVVYPTYLTYKFKQTHHVDTNTALDSPLQCAMMDQAGVPRLTIDSRLADALKHPVGYELFKDYLTTEFSVENLLCWSSVTSIIKDCEQRAAIPPEEFNKTFNDFYKMYIATGCPNEVNISHAARGRLRKYAGGRARASLAASVLPLQTVVVAVDDGYHGRVSALRELQREVFKLMESDSFARFKQSKEFAKLIAEQQ